MCNIYAMCFAVCSLVEMGNGTALHFTQRFLLASTFRLLGSVCSFDRRRTRVYFVVDASLFHFFGCLHFVDMYTYNETCIYILSIIVCVFVPKVFMLTLRRYLSFSLGTRLQRFPADFGAVVRGKGGIPRPGLVCLWETKQFAMEIVHNL